jgi:hypothetical protein
MRDGLTISITALLTLTALAAQGQEAKPGSVPSLILSSGSVRPSAELARAEIAGEVLREIDDPRNGDRWLLIEDARHPGGPGVLVLAHHDSARLEVRSCNASTADVAAPVIRAGDRVIVEERTAVVEARLEAVAMGPALAGAAFKARLSVGGMMVRAVALGPGRAVVQEETRR